MLPQSMRSYRVAVFWVMFLTGGSSFIPAVRRSFAACFGDERLAEGHNFLSVAYGLALIGLENDIEPWLASPAAT